MKILGIGLFTLGAATIALSVWTADAGMVQYTYDVDCQENATQDMKDVKTDRMRRPNIVPGMI